MAATPTADRLDMRMDVIVPLVYAAGGLRPRGYGFISGGYGGGVDIDQYDQIRWLAGFVDGVAKVNEPMAVEFLGEINAALLAAYPGEIQPDDVPFRVDLLRAEGTR